MPPPSPSQVKFIQNKLQTLEQQKTHFSGVVDSFFNKAVSAGRCWLETQDVDGNQVTFSDLSQMLDSSAFQLVEAELSLNSSSAYSAEMALSASFTQQVQLTKEAQENLNTQSLVKQETAVDLKKVFARCEVIEAAVASFRSITDKVTKQQAVLDTSINELSGKQRDFEEQSSRRLEQFEKSLKKQTTKKSEIKELKDKLSEQDGKLNTLTSQQTVMEKKENKKWLEYEQKLSDVSREQQEMDTKVNAIEDRLEEHGSEMTELSQELGQTMENVMTNKLSEMEARWTQLSGTNDDLKTNMEELKKTAKETATQVKKLSVKTGELETNMSKVSKQTDENVTAIKGLSSEQMKNQAVIRKMMRQLKDVKQKRNIDLREYKVKYEMVCQIVADRVSPLERLREILNRKIDIRNKHVDTLHDLDYQVTQLTRKVKQLDQVDNQVTSLQVAVTKLETSQVSCVGFSAGIPYNTVAKVGVLCDYKTPTCNVGQHFDPKTGVFTAPTDGMCFVGITIYQMGEGALGCHMIHERLHPRAGEEKTCEVSYVYTEANKASSSDSTLYDVRKGDTIFVRVFTQTEEAKILYANFCSFMMG